MLSFGRSTQCIVVGIGLEEPDALKDTLAAIDGASNNNWLVRPEVISAGTGAEPHVSEQTIFHTQGLFRAELTVLNKAAASILGGIIVATIIEKGEGKLWVEFAPEGLSHAKRAIGTMEQSFSRILKAFNGLTIDLIAWKDSRTDRRHQLRRGDIQARLESVNRVGSHLERVSDSSLYLGEFIKLATDGETNPSCYAQVLAEHAGFTVPQPGGGFVVFE